MVCAGCPCVIEGVLSWCLWGLYVVFPGMEVGKTSGKRREDAAVSCGNFKWTPEVRRDADLNKSLLGSNVLRFIADV